MEQFDIPVCLFLFQRKDTVLRIIERIAQVQPRKMYLMSDQGRNDEECARVTACRAAAEAAIDWPCELIKDYASANRGVFQNIGLGAMRVFEQEEKAIFLEDDNLPEITFFQYCKEMLERYEENDRILWICGTNYLAQYNSPANESYMFTQHLLPCGWASWRKKYVKYYDAYFKNYNDIVVARMRETYDNKSLFKQQMVSINGERTRMHKGEPFRSWDFQMCFSIRSNDLLGISPSNNQIKNIGVDTLGTHGVGNDIMTQRFCGMESHALDFPLHHPATILVDPVYEKKIGNIILYPLSWRIRKPFGVLKRKIRSHLLKCFSNT